MPIAFITLKMVFVLAWTIGDACSLSCQSYYQSCFVCSMSSDIGAQSKFNTVIKCGTAKKVAKEPPWSFLPASTIPTTAVRGFFGRFCMYGVILETE